MREPGRHPAGTGGATVSTVRQRIAVTLAELDALIAELAAADEERARRRERLCTGLTAAGVSCGSCRQSGSRYCWAHRGQAGRAVAG